MRVSWLEEPCGYLHYRYVKDSTHPCLHNCKMHLWPFDTAALSFIYLSIYLFPSILQDVSLFLCSICSTNRCETPRPAQTQTDVASTTSTSPPHQHLPNPSPPTMIYATAVPSRSRPVNPCMHYACNHTSEDENSCINTQRSRC